jgi:hypothetical protein
MRRKHEMPERRRWHALVAQILHAGNVAEPFRHLAAIGKQELAVAPEP